MKYLYRFVLLFLCACVGCMAVASAQSDLQTVYCAEQSFSLQIPADKTAYWEDDVGMTVPVGTPGYVPFIAVLRRTGEQRFHNPVNYLNNVYREYMEDRYEGNVGTNPCASYEIGGKTLLAAHYHYAAGGHNLVLSLMIELREDGDVEYFAKYQEGKGEETLALLDTVVRYYQPDTEDVDAALSEVVCEEQKYSTRMPAGLTATFQEDNGLRIWGGEEGYVPNVQIWRRTSQLQNPEKYVREDYTEYMKETYGERLVGISLHEFYDVGGKQLLGATYIYRGSSGASINQIHLVEVREDGDVEYNARFLNDEREATLEILDAAVRYHAPAAETY